MVKLINRTTGSVMWVHEDRLDEYLRAGHKLAPAPPPPPPAPRTTRPPKSRKSAK